MEAVIAGSAWCLGVDFAFPRSFAALVVGCLSAWAVCQCFVNGPAARREVSVAAAAEVKYETDMPAENGVYPVGNAKRTAPYGERDPLPEGYGIRTGLSDLLKPLNAEAGVVAKEDSIPTVLVMASAKHSSAVFSFDQCSTLSFLVDQYRRR